MVLIMAVKVRKQMKREMRWVKMGEGTEVNENSESVSNGSENNEDNNEGNGTVESESGSEIKN